MVGPLQKRAAFKRKYVGERASVRFVPCPCRPAATADRFGPTKSRRL